MQQTKYISSLRNKIIAEKMKIKTNTITKPIKTNIAIKTNKNEYNVKIQKKKGKQLEKYTENITMRSYRKLYQHSKRNITFSQFYTRNEGGKT